MTEVGRRFIRHLDEQTAAQGVDEPGNLVKRGHSGSALDPRHPFLVNTD